MVDEGGDYSSESENSEVELVQEVSRHEKVIQLGKIIKLINSNIFLWQKKENFKIPDLLDNLYYLMLLCFPNTLVNLIHVDGYVTVNVRGPADAVTDRPMIASAEIEGQWHDWPANHVIGQKARSLLTFSPRGEQWPADDDSGQWLTAIVRSHYKTP